MHDTYISKKLSHKGKLSFFYSFLEYCQVTEDSCFKNSGEVSIFIDQNILIKTFFGERQLLTIVIHLQFSK